MNVFYLHTSPIEAARMHCDKHCCKMIIEYGQLLSTAHRVLDGTMEWGQTKTGRKAKRWRLPDDRERELYLASHIQHPSGIWVRSSSGNYDWLYNCFVTLCAEVFKRYGKIHETARKLTFPLQIRPQNISMSDMTEPPQCMPEDAKIVGSSLDAYRNYYIKYKHEFAKWKMGNIPSWYSDNLEKGEYALL